MLKFSHNIDKSLELEMGLNGVGVQSCLDNGLSLSVASDRTLTRDIKREKSC